MKAFNGSGGFVSSRKMIIISARGIHMKGPGALAGTCLIIPPVMAAGFSYFAGGGVSSDKPSVCHVMTPRGD